MRGTILGFSDNNGVLITADDRRFHFTSENWRETEPPVRGAQVDFVERGDNADEIYFALGAAQPAAPPAAGAAAAYSPAAEPPPATGTDPGQAVNDALRRLGARIRAFPQTLLAVLILFTFLAISYAAIGSGAPGARNAGLGGREYPTLLTFNDTLGPVRDEIGQLGERLDRQREALADTPAAPSEFRARQEQQLARQSGAYSRLSWTLTAAYLFWFIPILCIAVVILKLAGKRALAVASSIALGLLSLVAAFYIMLLEGAMIALAESQFEPGAEFGLTIRRQIGHAFDLGFGGWLIGILGAACIVVVFLPRRDHPAQAEAAPAPEVDSAPA
jgi:hypothetical protein